MFTKKTKNANMQNNNEYTLFVFVAITKNTKIQQMQNHKNTKIQKMLPA